ncbi:hypothetical protein JR316_0010268 [Psilocybe cubensis]|uniref:Uncharacterized protein n=2 Tax=Psilocybe cubensis TaxID=181762 RepID=A0A8H7XSF8_PSICU|nr:hypothetical protein JR316_0010268 [Psilocybe cubensis]KAH9478032.1 hypothetical protein JR316_0010268 [Psilocybe cubensis]
MPLPVPVPAQAIPIPVVPRRPLKRSASTASLPTPPRTHRRHTRGRSRGSCDSDSDSDAHEHAVLSSDDDNDAIEAGIHQKHKNKKRRTGDAVEDNEEAFWLGSGTGSAGLNATLTGGSSKSGSSSKNHGVPLLYRRLLAQTETEVDVAPVSPPPSNRKTAVAVSPVSDPELTESPSPPFTPRTRSQTKKAALTLRDSPDNPFLVTPQKQLNSRSATTSPKTPTPLERPNLTYVFRGVRRVFNNPLFNHQEGRAYSPPPESKLPIDHPDYSPALNCPPKLLFPEARRGKGKKPVRATRNRKRSPSISGDEGEDEEHDLTAAIRPKLLNFGPPKAKVQTLDQELKSAGEPLST